MNLFKRLFVGRKETNAKLLLAIKKRNVNEVQALLAAGANANVRAKRPVESVAPAIHFALPTWRDTSDNSEDACLQIIDRLLESGADIDAPGSDGYGSKEGTFTPLMNAVQNGRVRTVRRLIERGANTSVRTLDGRTAFQLCMDDERTSHDHGYWEVVRVMAEHTAEGRAWAQSPKGQGWFRDHEEDPAAPLGVSPAGAFKILQRALSEIGEPVEDDVREIARQKTKRQQEELIGWVESGGSVSWTCSEGMTLLHYAAFCGNHKVVRFLLDHGADVNARDRFNKTPLHFACLNFRTKVIPTLLDHGADPNAQTEGGYAALEFLRRSPIGAESGMVQLLIRRGAVDSQN